MSHLTPYKIGTKGILLPSDHPLPPIQAQHPLYDRFPFFLASLCKPGEWIIDVGANIGDTLTAFVQSTMGSVLAIEGHRPYFDLLTQNVYALPAGMRSRIKCHCSLVGTGSISGSLVASKGTATLLPGSDNQQQPLDAILTAYAISPASVAILKTDTDGYDADILLSAPRLLAEGSPVLFFENQFENDSQMERYEEMYAALAKIGYTQVSVFDNFGNLMLDAAPIAFLQSLNRYQKAQNINRATRATYYFDVLAYRDGRADSVAALLTNYRKYILQN